MQGLPGPQVRRLNRFPRTWKGARTVARQEVMGVGSGWVLVCRSAAF